VQGFADMHTTHGLEPTFMGQQTALQTLVSTLGLVQAHGAVRVEWDALARLHPFPNDANPPPV
jgi:hypothetical protein